MKYCVMMSVAAAFVAAGAEAQTSNPLVTESKQAYTGIKSNLLKMAEKMPDDQYGSKPTPEIRTFGQLVAHVADSQMRNCSVASSGESVGDCELDAAIQLGNLGTNTGVTTKRKIQGNSEYEAVKGAGTVEKSKSP